MLLLLSDYGFFLNKNLFKTILRLLRPMVYDYDVPGDRRKFKTIRINLMHIRESFS